MAGTFDIEAVKRDITDLQRFWQTRNKKFREWYGYLMLTDTLAKKGLESYVSNSPQTFYNMAHYLLTRGELTHAIPVNDESALELDKRAKVQRGCQYIWKLIDRDRKNGGSMPFFDELGHYLLILGWYSGVLFYDAPTGLLKAQLWNPYDVYPQYADGQLSVCVHSYKVTTSEAVIKAQNNKWNYKPSGTASLTSQVSLDDYWKIDKGVPYNMVLIDGKPVTALVSRPEMKVLVSPVGGFPDRGSLNTNAADWIKLAGRSIFEVNESVTDALNKWKTMISQILRDTAQPITQEFSQTPNATAEQLRERGALFHYAPGENGLQRLPPPAIPIELQSHLLDIEKEVQKGSFNDAVFGMMEGQSGYALSTLASSSANQILYPYMDAKHFFIEEADSFWLTNIKNSHKVFTVQGDFIEQLKPEEIPVAVNVTVNSEVATPKDMLEKGTIATYLSPHLDEATLLRSVLGQKDPEAVIRAKRLDTVLNSPEAIMIQKITGFRAHALYLQYQGDSKQAELFNKMADALEAQMGAPAPGQGNPLQQTNINAQRLAGGNAGNPNRNFGAMPNVAPPEANAGFTPQQLRNIIGQGNIRRG
jgi:hypothetical protein